MFKGRKKKDSPEQEKIKELNAKVNEMVSIQKELVEYVEVLKEATVVLTKGSVVILKKMIRDGAKENEKKPSLNDDDSYKIMFG